MKNRRGRRAGAAGDGRGKHRRRVMPKWLKDPGRLDAIAHSRCMMVLSVLSGEVPVTEAIAQSRISRGTYYQLEARALKAMLAALNPLASAKKGSPADLSATRIQGLLERIRLLEQDKRRMKRLVLLARKVRETETVEERLARRRLRARLGLIANGKRRSQGSARTMTQEPLPSTPTKTGGSAC